MAATKQRTVEVAGKKVKFLARASTYMGNLNGWKISIDGVQTWKLLYITADEALDAAIEKYRKLKQAVPEMEVNIPVISGGARPRHCGSVWRPCLVVDRETTPHGHERIRVRLVDGCRVKMKHGKTWNIYPIGHEIWVGDNELRKKEDK